MAESRGRSRVADATGSLRRRRRQQRRRRLIAAAAAVLVVGLIVGATWVVGFSSVLAARQVVVRGVSLLAAGDVENAAAVPLGTPLARLDTTAIADRVATLPAARSATVTVSLPDTVVITVSERTAVYAVSQSGNFLLVDSAGVGYQSVPDLPEGLLGATITPANDERLFRDVAIVVAAMPPSLREQAALVTADSPDHIVIQLARGAQVIWGSAEQSDLKAQVIVGLLTIQASQYDVSSPSHPATRP